jgi:hypothetical protein
MRVTHHLRLLGWLLTCAGALVLAAPAISLAGEPGAATTTGAPAERPRRLPRRRLRPPKPPPPPPAQPPRRLRRGDKLGGSSRDAADRGPAPQGTTPGARQRRAPEGRWSRRRRSRSDRGLIARGARAAHHAPSPSTLTPSLPFALESSISGVPGFFIESFRIPPFLLPIYQAAGTAYGIPWQVLAAINEVETDYGRDLSVSSAGAEGWMQFLPAEWAQYGVDANGDGFKDPYNPADAIFAAARYLRAAGGSSNIRAAVFSYNHSQAYVSSVMLRAQLLGGTPPNCSARSPGSPRLASRCTPPRTTATASRGAGERIGPAEDARRHDDLLAAGRTRDRRPGRRNRHRSATRPRSGGSCRCATHMATPTSTPARLVAALYPVLEPHVHTTVSARIAQAGGAGEPAPAGPATAGAQPRSPLSEGATVSGLALGAAAGLEAPRKRSRRRRPPIHVPPTARAAAEAACARLQGRTGTTSTCTRCASACR